MINQILGYKKNKLVANFITLPTLECQYTTKWYYHLFANWTLIDHKNWKRKVNAHILQNKVIKFQSLKVWW